MINQREIIPIQETTNRVVISQSDYKYLLKCQKRTEQIRKNQRIWDAMNRKYGVAKKNKK